MLELRSISFGLVLLSGFLLAVKVGDYKNIYAKSFRCNGSEKFAYPNVSCSAKSYSRSVSVINGYGLAKFPLYNITVFAILYYKYGTVYRQVMYTPKVNVCEVTKWLVNIDDKSPNKLVASIVKVIKASDPDLIHECPYHGIKIRNFTVNIASIPDIFPSGDYKAYGQLAIGDEVFSHATAYGSVASSNKDTFG